MSEKRGKKTISNEIREIIINKLNSGLSIKTVAEMYGQKPNTITKLYKKYEKTGMTKKQNCGHRNKILSDIHIENICDWLQIDCTLTLKQLQTKILTNFPEITKISLTTIDRALKEFHFSFKRITFVPEARNTPETIQKRFDYAIQYNKMMINKDRMFFIDETGIQIFSRATYGRSMVGTKAHKLKKIIRSKNYSIASAMNENSLFFFEIKNTPYNSDEFTVFLTQLFNHLLENKITGAYIIMDNVRFHKTHQVISIVEGYGHNAIFLPPYSPFLNPIEELFNQWKGLIRRTEPENEDELYNAVNNTSDKITPQNCQNYIRHMESYLNNCLNKEIIES